MSVKAITGTDQDPDFLLYTSAKAVEINNSSFFVVFV